MLNWNRLVLWLVCGVGVKRALTQCGALTEGRESKMLIRESGRKERKGRKKETGRVCLFALAHRNVCASVANFAR